MLSVILYGRNDDHGYNYHKRLSVSINAIAQLLTEPGDEILFTDYNSPNDFPTVVEAIRDTLTPRAKELIRVFRVRPEQHRQFSKETSLPLLEPVARNVAIRRSNPANKWVLSTNADMLFVPKMEDESLSSIVSILEDGFYSAPRFELPEQFWEMVLDRMDPNGNLRFLREKCRNLRLNTVVKAEGFIQYDNPGDFQLLLRKDLLEMGGFDERMLKGWHVDANLCKRASLLIKRGGSLEDRLITFHCNHTQKASVLHSKVHTENDWSVFVDNAALTPRQPVEDWGLAREEVEEVDFKETGRLVHVKALAAVLEGSLEMEEKLSIGREHYNVLTYSPARVFPFLADHLCNLPKSANIAYIGCNEQVVLLMRGYLERIGFEGKLLTSEVGMDELVKMSSLFIFDFGLDAHSEAGRLLDRNAIKPVMWNFMSVMKARDRVKSGTKFIGINVTRTDFQFLFNRHLATQVNSLLTGIVYGYLPSKQRRKRSTSGFYKKRLKNLLRYCTVRYFFDYSDAIRKRALNFRKKD